MNNPLRRFLLVLGMMILLAVLSRAQGVTNSQPDQYEKKTYVAQNGTWQWTRTIETERHVTSEGEVELQRLRAPAYEGDNSVSWEREVHTRKLSDGTVEKEYILRNQDGSGHLAPVQIIREKSISGGDSAVLQRETLERPGGADWEVIQKESVTENGPDDAKESFKAVQRLNLATHQWETVEQDKSVASTSTEGGTTETETKSVKQTPDAWGKLADFERRQERTVSSDGKQTTESTVYRRDDSRLDPVEPAHFYLLERTTSDVVAVAPGTTTRHVVRESDWLFDDHGRTYSRHPEIVEETTAVETTTPDGSRHTETKVTARTSADATSLRPIYTVVEDSDTAGYVRRIYIPAR